VNGWTTDREKLQHLLLCMEGPAAEVVNEIDDADSKAYEQMWVALSRRFGDIQEERENMRRFDQRKQLPGETIAEFEQSLKTLYRQAWPQASLAQKDSDLKRKFEDSLTSQEMTNYLRLHARKDNFSETVNKARQFETLLSSKKSVKLVTPDTPAVNSLQTDLFQDILDGIETVVEKVLAKQNLKVVQGNKPRQTYVNVTPFQDRQSAVPPTKFNDGRRTPSPTVESDRPQRSRAFNNNRLKPGNRQSFPDNRQPHADMTDSQLQSSRPASPVNRSQPAQARAQSVPPNSRRRPGCWVCGVIGCHSDRHDTGTPPGSDNQTSGPTGSQGDLRQPSAPHDEQLNSRRRPWMRGTRTPVQSRPASH